MLRDNSHRSSQRKFKLTAQEFTPQCHASRSGKKKNTVTGVGYIGVRSDKHCRHN